MTVSSMARLDSLAGARRQHTSRPCRAPAAPPKSLSRLLTSLPNPLSKVRFVPHNLLQPPSQFVCSTGKEKGSHHLFSAAPKR